MNTENEKLKPCPFCGGEAEIFGHTASWDAMCTKCVSCNRQGSKTEAEAIKKWNNRVDLNYSEKQNSSKELLKKFIKWDKDSSVRCNPMSGLYEFNSLILEAEKLVNSDECCEKSYKEENAKLTYADVEKMVKPLEWRMGVDGILRAPLGLGCTLHITQRGNRYDVECNARYIKSESTEVGAKKIAQNWYLDIVADALGVERGK